MEMENAPVGALLAKDDAPAGQTIGVAEVKSDQHQPPTQRLNAQIGRNESMEWRPAGRASADVGDYRSRRRIGIGISIREG